MADQSPFQSYFAKWARLFPFISLACGFSRHWQNVGAQALCCLQHEWAYLAFGISDENVAKAKFAWWMEEWQALLKGQPTHPITKTILVHVPASTLPALQDSLIALWSSMQHESILTPDELVEKRMAWVAPFIAQRNAANIDANACRRAAMAWIALEIGYWRVFKIPARAQFPLGLLAQNGASRGGLERGEQEAFAARALCRELHDRITGPASILSIIDATYVTLAKKRLTLWQSRIGTLLREEAPSTSLRDVFKLWRLCRDANANEGMVRA